jgi:hypothetical protein
MSSTSRLGDSLLCFSRRSETGSRTRPNGWPQEPRYVDAQPANIAPPSMPEEVKNLLAQAMVDVRAKEINPRIASTITYMSGALLKSFERTDLQQRVARLEEASASKGGQVVSRRWKSGRCSGLKVATTNCLRPVESRIISLKRRYCPAFMTRVTLV